VYAVYYENMNLMRNWESAGTTIVRTYHCRRICRFVAVLSKVLHPETAVKLFNCYVITQPYRPEFKINFASV